MKYFTTEELESLMLKCFDVGRWLNDADPDYCIEKIKECAEKVNKEINVKEACEIIDLSFYGAN